MNTNLCEYSDIHVKTEDNWNVYHFAAVHTKKIEEYECKKKIKTIIMNSLLNHEDFNHDAINELCDYQMRRYSALDLVYHCKDESDLNIKLWELLISKGANRTNPGHGRNTKADRSALKNLWREKT